MAVRGRWWRIDPVHPDDWDWVPYPSPRGRFDPLSGRFRVRYAANRPTAAARERFGERAMTAADGDLWLVALDGLPAAVHLTRQATLDALGLDDRVSTGRLDVDRRLAPDPLLATCGQLADRLYDWWDGRPPPLVYRTRTMPAEGRSLAFGRHSPYRVRSARPLREATALCAWLVLHAGFTVPEGWL